MLFIMLSNMAKVVVACSATWNVLFSAGPRMMMEPAYNSEIGQVPSQAVILKRISVDTGLPYITNSVVLHFVERDVFIDPEWVAEVALPNESFEAFLHSLISYDLYDPQVDTYFQESMAWWNLTSVKFKHSYRRPNGPFVMVYVSPRETNVHLFINCSY